MHRDVLGHAHDERNPALSRFQNCGSSGRRWDDNERGVRATLFDSFSHRRVNGNALNIRARLLRVRPRHHLRAIVTVPQAVKAPLRSGQALHHHPAVLVSKNRHVYFSPASATAFCAASSIVVALITWSDSCCLSIARPSAEFVPSSRITSGARRSTFLSASTIPRATSSQRVIPPNMLIMIALTL